MRIIIAGEGETGSHLARMLSVEDQDIVLIGSDTSRLAELEAGGNFITFAGSPLSRGDLIECGAADAGLFVAVTPDETVNLIACQIAKDCGTRRCVARVDNPDLDNATERRLFACNGVDRIIFPEKIASGEIERFIDYNWVSEWYQLHEGGLIVAGVRMQEGGTMCGRYLRDVPNNPRLFHVAAVRRGEKVIIPRGDDRLMPGDTIYFALLRSNLGVLPAICGKTVTAVRHIMIAGAGRVTASLLESVAGRYEITVIDPDRAACRRIASRFPHTVTVNARVNDVATLQEEGLGRCDMFLALTGSAETNIVACMVAREHGVRKTLARIEELQYVPEAESLSIDKIINKKLINAGRILSALTDTGIDTTRIMSGGQAEITEAVAREGSRITGRPISRLSLPREFTVAGYIRDGEGFLAEGSTVILPGDRLVIFCVAGSLRKVDKFLTP